MSKIACRHCGADVWWSFPRAEDACYECGKPIGWTESTDSGSIQPQPTDDKETT